MSTETNNTKRAASPGAARYVVVAVLVVGAFFGAFRFAQARNAAAPAQSPVAIAANQASTDAAAGGAACACCGSSTPTANGVTGDPVEGSATVSGDVQKIDIDLSTGVYQPNVIKLKAGVPAEITFGQSGGCTGQVMSKDLNFFEDLTTGPKTVKVAALEPGEYAYSCGMEMVFGKIVVE